MIYTSFSFLALRLTVYVVSETLGDDASQLIAPLQKARSIFVSLDAMVDVIIFFKHYFIAPKPKRKQAVRGSQLYESNIAQRQSSFENQEGTSPSDLSVSNDNPRRGSESSENGSSNSFTAKVKNPFHRLRSIDSDAENMPRRSSLGSIDEEHNGENVHPHSSIMAKVIAPFHRKGSIDSNANSATPHTPHPRRNSLGSIKEEHSGEDLHPVRLHVINGNETFNLPKWILREYATDVMQTENTLLLDSVVEEA